MAELPADLVVGDFWPAGCCEAGSFGGISGGAQCVRAHVADGYGLTGGSGSSQCGGIFYITGRDATGETTANFLSSVEFSAGERAGPGDGRARAVITWSFGLEEPQNPLGTVSRPCGDKTSVSFA